MPWTVNRRMTARRLLVDVGWSSVVAGTGF